MLYLFDPPPAGVGVSRRVKKAEMCCKPELLVLPFCWLPVKIPARFPNGWEMLELLSPGASCQPAHPFPGDLSHVHGVRESKPFLVSHSL